MKFDNSYVQIDLDAIDYNISQVIDKAKTDVMAVVKANAYGHGAVQVATLLKDKCAYFGVSSVPEAMELIRAGIEKPILILGHTDARAFPVLVKYRIRPTIFRWEDALALSQEAVRQNATAPCHLAVDTGMGRIGFQVTAEDVEICSRIANLPGIQVEGLFSHFATADSADLSAAQQQAERFEAFDRALQQLGVDVPLRHMNNSAGLMNFRKQYDLVRSGIVTYGLYPSDEVDPAALKLRPAMEWFSRVSHVKTLSAGRPISYGGTFVTEKETRVATIPVGYADGYSRSLSGKFYVLIRGKRAPILGRICMDQMMVDVTDIPQVQLGDKVTLVGKDGEEAITVEQIANMAGSFNYEFVCSIGRRVPREYWQNGQMVCAVNYLLEDM